MYSVRILLIQRRENAFDLEPVKQKKELVAGIPNQTPAIRCEQPLLQHKFRLLSV